MKTNSGTTQSFKVEKETANGLNELSRQQGSTLFMTLLSAFNVLLYRYSGQSDISVGTSITNRPQQEIENLIGFFVNTLALRSEVSNDETFIELLHQVKQTTLDAYSHQEVPFEKVVDAVVKDRDPGRSPLFQVMLVLHNTPEVPQLQLGEVRMSTEAFENNVSKFEITFFVNETPNGLMVSVQYRSDLYSERMISRMTEHFKELLRSVIKDPDQKIGLLPMLSKEEEHQLSAEINTSAVIYPKDKSIVDLFEDQVKKTPHAAAVVFEGKELSYLELNERSNQLAHYLRSKGVKEETAVPLYSQRGIEMMIGMLGIMKSGAAYVPVDTDFPQDRIRYMLEDTKAKIIVSSKQSRSKLPFTENIEVIEIEKVTGEPKENLQTKVSPDNLAYVIYTSGSTGKPKGVMIEHRSLVDYVFGLNEKISINESRSFALVSTIATDLGNTVIYSSLLTGGALHLFTKESVSNIEYIHGYFKEHSIDCLKIVPSHWKALMNEDKLLLPKKLLVFGGEALQSELIEKIRETGTDCRIVNHYGPTETTIGKLLHEVDTQTDYTNFVNTIPIGKPFSNTQVYILTKDRQLCPAGVPGELYISGDGVARGYFNNEELTKAKFVENPFEKVHKVHKVHKVSKVHKVHKDDEHDSLMYGTGDLVKYLPDGNILFIGRVDDQIKIRGYRIELGEIESVLQQSESVSQAVVLAREDKQGNRRLVGYVTIDKETGRETGRGFDKEAITSFLKEKLPEYMVPSVLIELTEFPLTANGKTDRNALPDPETLDIMSEGFTAPRNEAETKLAEIWKEVLEVDQVGIHDDFFELGGHSLLAVRLISAIRKAFNVEMPIGDIFDYPTVALLSGQLEVQSDAEVLPAIEVIKERPQRIPLSFSQERLWFIDHLEGSVQYHVPSVLRLTGKLNTEALERSLRSIIERHEVLRTVIREEEGVGYQFIKDSEGWSLETIDGKEYSEDKDKDKLQSYIKQLISTPFNLSEDYMLRAQLIKMSEEDHVLAVTLHHIASDGWSTSVIVKELVELYGAFEEGREPKLQPLPLQYADYAMWQRKYLQGEVLEKKLEYWKENLAGSEPLQLPTDFNRPAMQSIRGAVAGFKIEKDISDKLNKISQENGTTLFMTLLAALNVLLYRYSSQHDICIGTPVAGRQQQNLEGLIGFFINTLALRSEVNGNEGFKDLLQKIKATTLKAYEYQDVPFEKVVDAVVKDRDQSRTPIFQVMFVLQNTPDIPKLQLGNVMLSKEGHEHTSAKFDLTVNINETAQGFVGNIQYCTDLFNADTINRMIEHFKELLKSIVLNPEQNVGEMSMLTKEELHMLRVEFNNTKVDFQTDKTPIDLFEEHAEKTPDSPAIFFGSEKLTYKELNERSNKLAHYLISKGVKDETLIPICMDRSAGMIIGILGVLKSGGAYVPVDPEYPDERIRFMLEDTDAAIVLSSKSFRSKIPVSEKIEIIEIGGDWSKIDKMSYDNPDKIIKPDQLAYVIYTSGSTGKPKGVMIENSGLLNLIMWHNQTYKVTSQSRCTAMAGVGFDAFGWEIWPYLSAGASITIIDDDTRLSTDALLNLINQNRITHSFMPTAIVPEFINESLDKLDSLRYLLTGGDKLQGLLMEHKTFKLVNNYGPTENTVVTSFYELSEKDSYITPPIGKPISNTVVYILDECQNNVPVGVTGEICIEEKG
ncbi:MAG: amino acid adenylation domain-containing protein [Ignavibacteria bacterium]|nr:amino acid adenylation domain-containing protein [Ignavibacteria bacterium]